ncbi:peptidoglycan-binding protein [uncultured Clostridium sp.]|uniref:peptidoglycan-binding protein n=1 Tax=uncultured Clostridium sp. TaxID=59620 RepID=UPI0025CEBED4|nr:N-acetylmuramoyl-L-alanine amidase [uncultured Clostridium sp.]MDU4883947.1 N-acetylmuramoyl-L-alanine amidase [Clostridium celatum]MDU7077200.1 N-acetylmuramoyl-L-alanine amidase [Clostridium celatum]
MKIAVRGGHCPKVPGARGILDELTEDRKVKDAVIKYLKQSANEVLDVTSPDSTSTSSADLSYGVNNANNWGADLFVSIHFNKAYDYYNGALGSEVCVYSTYDIAQRVVNALGALGFKNRGQKIRTGLYELRNTSMKAMIVETCFVEATEDVELYRKLGADTIGKVIAEAIVFGSLGNSDSEIQSDNNESQLTGDDWIRRLQEECNKQGFSNQKVDGYPGPNTLKGCPIMRQGARGNITKLLQEKLVSFGYNTNGVDGIFGMGTKAAVIAFQKSKGLSADGIVGQNTWRKLLNL